VLQTSLYIQVALTELIHPPKNMLQIVFKSNNKQWIPSFCLSPCFKDKALVFKKIIRNNKTLNLLLWKLEYTTIIIAGSIEDNW